MRCHLALMWCLLAAPSYAQYVYSNPYQCGSMVCGYVVAEDYTVDGGVEALVEADASLYGPNGFITSNWTQNYYSAYTPIQAPANTAGFYMLVGNGFAQDPSTEIWGYIGQSTNSVYIQAALSVNIQLQSNFISAGGNCLALMGGPGGIQTPLYAYGAPGGGSYQWTLGPNLQPMTSLYTQTPSITGSAPSSAGGDTWVQVTYTLNGQQAIASIRCTSLNPTTWMTAAPTNQWLPVQTIINQNGTGILFRVIYHLFDPRLGQIAMAGVPWSETLTTLYCAACAGVTFVPADGVATYGYSNATGDEEDDLVSFNVSPQYVKENSQFINANGWIFSPTQTQVITYSSALITQSTLTH